MRARSVLSTQMQKTKLCDFHKEGRCKYGASCAFAHEETELKRMPDLRKTRICRAFMQGQCQDTNCKFAHGNEELRATDLCYKTALCTWHEKGKCASGDQCRFAHGPKELRAEDEEEGSDGRRQGRGGDNPSEPAPKMKLKRRLRQRMRKASGTDAATESKRDSDGGADDGGGSRPASEERQSRQEQPQQQRPQKRARSPSSVCPRCESTVAVRLGITVCQICRM